MYKDRKYIAISIKHTEYRWKFGKPCVLCGTRYTDDSEGRCFSGYTEYLANAERYALGDFKKHHYGSEIKDDEPVRLCIDFCKKWRKYDTVLVDVELYQKYCDIAEIPTEPLEGEYYYG